MMSPRSDPPRRSSNKDEEEAQMKPKPEKAFNPEPIVYVLMGLIGLPVSVITATGLLPLFKIYLDAVFPQTLSFLNNIYPALALLPLLGLVGFSLYALFTQPRESRLRLLALLILWGAAFATIAGDLLGLFTAFFEGASSIYYPRNIKPILIKYPIPFMTNLSLFLLPLLWFFWYLLLNTRRPQSSIQNEGASPQP